MGKKICTTAMLVTAFLLLILMPVGLDAVRPDDTPQPSVTTTTTAEVTTPLVTTAPADTEETVTTITTADNGEVTTQPPETSALTQTTVVSDSKKPETTTQLTGDKTTVTTSSATKKPVVTTTTKKVTTTTTTKKTTTTTTKKPVVTTTTTTKKPDNNPPANVNAPKGSPVYKHGQLSVKGANIVDQNGNKFQLIGMSTHGVGWFPDTVNKNTFKILRDDWGCNTIRLAMYIEESWGGSESCYLQDKERNLNLVRKGIDYAIDLGMYVIVDWHVLNPGNPSTHTADAQKFFETIAKEYGNCPNILYELCNEPNGGVNWSGTIKPYCEKVIKSVRKYDSDAIVICGTGTWSQDIHDVLGKTLSDKNTVYALHFYANTHTDWLRQRVKDCYNKGLPILVTEFGTCDASGNGGFNTNESNKWFDTLDKLNIGYINWSICNKNETASIFKSGTDLKNIKAGESQLTESGKFIRKQFRKKAGLN